MQADPETGAYGTRAATSKGQGRGGNGKKEWLQSTPQTVNGARIEARQDIFSDTNSFNDAGEGCEEGRSWQWPMGHGEVQVSQPSRDLSLVKN